jgi:penicillin-binding protein 1A
MGLFSAKAPPPPRPAPKRASFMRRAALLGSVYAAIFASAGVGLMLVYCSAVYPDPHSLRASEPAPLIRILARDGSQLAVRGGADDYVPLDMLPAHVANAVIATEDQRFYAHRGVDPVGLVRAIVRNMRSGRFVQGGSTLTQQLAKNLYLTSERTLARKLEELSLAIWLEARLSKEDILELYLNRVYLGSGAYGIDAAARRYFNKPARKLTLPEAALIAGLLKAPSRYSPVASPEAARDRGRLVLRQMQRAGLITSEEERQATRAMADVADIKEAEPNGAEYVVDYILEHLPAAAKTAKSEVIVETTIDAALQADAARSLARRLDAQGEVLSAGQGAIVVVDGRGGIRALVGGRAYAASQYNRALKARRQPGSAFKPFVYLAALERGMHPDSVVQDIPVSVAGWAPRNFSGDYKGAMSMRTSLARSVNTVAVRLALQAGPTRVASAARRLGIVSPLGKDASIALGTSEVSLLELTRAYSVFSNGGRKTRSHVVRRVLTRAGQVLFTRTQQPSKQVVQPSHVAAMNDMLNAAIATGTGRRAAFAGHPAAGKTGTSQGFRDAWFVGYSAHLTAGVWIGNDNGRSMNLVSGGTLPAEVWREVMEAAHARLERRALPGASVVAPPVARHPTRSIDSDLIARALAGQ